MTEEGFTACLRAVLDGELGVNESLDPDAIDRIETYEEAGILTRDHGLIVSMADGSEFHLRIVKSKPGRGSAQEA